MTNLDHFATPYADAVRAYAEREWAPASTPGHQSSHVAHPALLEFFGKEIIDADVQPLVDRIDYGTFPTPQDLSLALAADAWGAKRTWWLTNGASQGNLIATLTLANLGTHVVVQRNMHSSVIDGLAMSGLDAVFVHPSVDLDLGVSSGITPESLDNALKTVENPAAAYIVTPSYFGSVADVAALAAVAHSHGVPLIVDEAWGAHFGFHELLPNNALRLGADLVISSTHKLAGSLTQSAMLHLGHGEFAATLEPLVERAYRSMQSTSASALLMASLDLARKDLMTADGSIYESSVASVDTLREGIARTGRFADIAATLMTYDDVIAIDPMRISLNTRIGGISGHEARALLFHEHAVHCEMATDSTLVMLFGAGTAPDTDRILTALHALPTRELESTKPLALPAPGTRKMRIRDAYFSETEIVSAHDAIGRVSADAVAAYPPGIPNLLPGEEITHETVSFLQATIAAPFGHVRGGAAKDMSAFRVVKK